MDAAPHPEGHSLSLEIKGWCEGGGEEREREREREKDRGRE